ncbi:hypothetical protein WN982_40190 [Paraburkholderia sp. IMGN_8]
MTARILAAFAYGDCKMDIEVFCKLAMVAVGVAGNVKFLYDR